MEAISKAFQNRQSNVEVQAIGKVKAILPDDNEGSRHQKFILSLDNGLTVLVAHNIDLAPRIDGLQKGDMVEFLGGDVQLVHACPVKDSTGNTPMFVCVHCDACSIS